MNSISPELQRLQVLQAFKRRMPRSDGAENISPFDDRVCTSHGSGGGDLADIHASARQGIRRTLEAVRDGSKKSQVILLAGDAGTGKTHLLNTFHTAEMAEQVGYIYVGGSNHWTIEEFQAQLLDWIITALTDPSPSGDHLLLERIRAIGFRAVDHLLANPVAWRQCLARPRGRWLGRLLGRLRAPSYDRFKKLADARDPSVFSYLDFARFGAYVCDRFLAERSNLTHRYALRILLLYLFPDKEETGVGTRERVLHWFRERGDNHYFLRRLGANERLNHQFSLFEAVKLLVHLFSPAVARELTTEKYPCRPRVFLLAFDQAEGRNALFDGDREWLEFFAHLSELYNNLPNVVVLFTMTISLRKRLHSQMERQFRDRIRMDDVFTLRFPDPGQVLSLYRSRLESWLEHDPIVLESYQQLENPYVPFDSEQVLAIAGQYTIRDTFVGLDKAFHKAMRDLIVDAELDYQYCLNELGPLEQELTEYQYTERHLETARELLQRIGCSLAEDNRVTLNKIEEVENADPETLALWLSDPSGSHLWVCAYLSHLTRMKVQEQVNKASELLKHRSKARYTLWLLRAAEMKAKLPKPAQSFERVTPPELESRFQALLHVARKQEDYEKDGQWEAAQQLIRSEVSKTYLGEVFREARKRLDAILTGSGADLSDAAEEPSEAEA